MLYEVDVCNGGDLRVWYMGQHIAVVDHNGRILWRDMDYPIGLLEYILMQPNHDNDIWN